jgi:hypothetical protein
MKLLTFAMTLTISALLVGGSQPALAANAPSAGGFTPVSATDASSTVNYGYALWNTNTTGGASISVVANTPGAYTGLKQTMTFYIYGNALSTSCWVSLWDPVGHHLVQYSNNSGTAVGYSSFQIVVPAGSVAAAESIFCQVPSVNGTYGTSYFYGVAVN